MDASREGYGKYFNWLDIELTVPLGERESCVNFLPAGKAEQAREENRWEPPSLLLLPVCACVEMRMCYTQPGQNNWCTFLASLWRSKHSPNQITSPLCLSAVVKFKNHRCCTCLRNCQLTLLISSLPSFQQVVCLHFPHAISLLVFFLQM